MMRRSPLVAVYGVLAAIGAIVPYRSVIPWLVGHGIDPSAFVGELFSTRIGSFFGWDVILSAVTVIVFVAVDDGGVGRRLRWLSVAATLLVGVSCGLPLYLGLREWAARGRPGQGWGRSNRARR